MPGFMRMSADDDIEACRRRIEVQFRQIVKYVDPMTSRFDHCCQREAGGPIRLINIASDSNNRCNRAKLIEDLRLADIAGMNDEMGTLQRGKRLRPHETVRIGDQTNLLHHRVG